MQFYEDGFDFSKRRWVYTLPPDLENGNLSETELPEEVDVLVVGTGPAGLLLSAQLSRFPNIKTCVIENKPGRLQLGQADGLQCRTLEIFEAFGFSRRVMHEAYFVNEVTFWAPDNKGGIIRTGRTMDTEDGLSEFPHVILNQARIHDFFLDEMTQSKKPLHPHYSKRLIDLERVDKPGDRTNVIATVQYCDNKNNGRTSKIRARYVVGCDGARSSVRSLMGFALRGDSANHAWGVMDVLVDTDFPDIRFKSAIKTEHDGTIVLIPREGGYLVRIYVEMGDLEPGERVASRNIQLSDVIAKTQKIFHPFKFEVQECPWWSVYEIGQRLTDRFDDGSHNQEAERNPHIFITGDACHTHSPKAGQGMNVSMADAFNLGWKLVNVILGSAHPSLLKTYSAERQSIAKELIDFDRYWANALTQSSDGGETNGVNGKPNGEKKGSIQSLYEKAQLFVSGLATRYPTSTITADSGNCNQNLARGYPIGERFKSCEVLRCFDAKIVHLGHVIKADSRWRILIFDPNPNPTAPDSKTSQLCQWLQKDQRSPVVTLTPQGAPLDSVVDVRAIFHVDHPEVDVNHVPDILRPSKGRYGLKDHEKVFVDRWTGGSAIRSIYKDREIDLSDGCMVIVRPDQYVSAVWALEKHERLADFFTGFSSRVIM